MADVFSYKGLALDANTPDQKQNEPQDPGLEVVRDTFSYEGLQGHTPEPPRLSSTYSKIVGKDAKILEAAQKVGIAPQLIEDTPEAKAAAMAKPALDLDKFQKDHPATAQHLANNPVQAKKAEKDLPLIDGIGNLFRYLQYRYDQSNRDLARAQLAGKLLARQYSDELERQMLIDQIRAPQDERIPPESTLEKWFGEPVEQVPVLGKVLGKGFEHAYTGAMVWGTGGAMVGIASPIPGDEIVTSISGAMHGARLGFRTGLVAGAYELESHAGFVELLNMQDRNGHYLPVPLAEVGAHAIGTLNALLESIGTISILKTIPKVKKLVESTTKAGAKGILQIPKVRNVFLRAAARYTGTNLTEITTEMFQEFNNIWIGEVLKAVDNADGAEFDYATKEEITTRLVEVAEKTLKSTMTFAAPGTMVNVGVGVTRVQQQKTQARVSKQAAAEHTANLETVAQQTESSELAITEVEGVIAELHKDHGIPGTSFIPAKALDDALKASEMPPDQAAALVESLGVEPEAYQKAVQDELPLPFPTEKKLSLSKTPVWENIKDQISFSPVNEADLDFTGMDTLLQKDEKGTGPDVERLAQDMAKAGYEPEYANLMARLVGARAQRWAAERGVDPADYFRRYGYDIERRGEGAGGYFYSTNESKQIPLENIRPRSKAIDPEKQARAGQLMDAAKQGAGKPRGPLRLVDIGEGEYWANDGNTTLAELNRRGESLAEARIREEALQRDKSPSRLIGQAAALQPRLNTWMQDWADKTGGELYTKGQIIGSRVKGQDSVTRKMLEFGSSADEIRDYLAGTVIYKDLAALKDAIRDMHREIKGLASKVDNRYSGPPTRAGYRDVSFNMWVEDEKGKGQIVEVQFNTKAMQYAKDALGHKLYELSREIDTLEAAGQLTDAQKRTAQQLDSDINALSQDLYRAADLAGRGLLSDANLSARVREISVPFQRILQRASESEIGTLLPASILQTSKPLTTKGTPSFSTNTSELELKPDIGKPSDSIIDTPTDIIKPNHWGDEAKIYTPRHKKGVPVRYALAEAKDLVPSHDPETFADNSVQPETNPLENLPDSALVMVADSGEFSSLPLNRFTPEEQQILKDAGLVSKIKSEPNPETGETTEYEAVAVDALWKERDRRFKALRAKRKPGRKRYPSGVQERDYKNDKREQLKVDDHAKRLVSFYPLAPSPDATNGPPIITPEGIVLGGNSRTMSLVRAYRLKYKNKKHGDQGAKYKKHLARHASQFGLDAESVRGMNEPVLVRVLDPKTDDPKELHRWSTELNMVPTQKMGEEAAAASAGANVSNRTLEVLGDLMARYDATVRGVLDKPKASEQILKRLVDDGVIAETEVGAIWSDKYSKMSSAGKRLVENMLLGSVLNDKELLMVAPGSVKNTIGRNLDHLTKLKSRGEGWDLGPDIRGAVQLILAVKDAGLTNIDEYYRQGDLGMGTRKDFSHNAIVLAHNLMAQKPNTFRAALKQYTDDAMVEAGGQTALLGPPDPNDSFIAAFGDIGQVLREDTLMNEAAGAIGRDDTDTLYQPLNSGVDLNAQVAVTHSQGGGFRQQGEITRKELSKEILDANTTGTTGVLNTHTKTNIQITAKGFKHLWKTWKEKRGPAEVYFEAASRAKLLLQRAYLAETDQKAAGTDDPGLIAVHHYFAPLMVGENLYTIQFTVKEFEGGAVQLNELESVERLYAEKVAKEMSAGTSQAYAPKNSDGPEPSADTISVGHMLSGVKGRDGKTLPCFPVG
jgi:hypothetical protein